MLVIEEIVWYDINEILLSLEDAQAVLAEAAEDYILQTTISGQILGQQIELMQQPGCLQLFGVFQCREMIARPMAGLYMKGDTQDDSQNSQRGAG